MTFNLQLAIWLAVSTAGVLTSIGCLRYATLILQAVRRRRSAEDVVSGSAHLWQTELERVIGWVMFLVLGILALFQPPPPQPVGTTPIGAVITWLLIGTVALWSFKTASDFFYTRGRFRRIKENVSP